MRAELFQGEPAAATTARDLERALLGLQSIAAGAGAIVERYNVAEQSEELDFAVRLLGDLVGLMSDFYEKIEPTVQSGRVDVISTGTAK
jgi:hypothetical protein